MRRFDQEAVVLSAEQEETLEVLLEYPTKTAAANALGISRPALYLRLEDPGLKEAYEEARRAAISDATDSLQTVAEQAPSRYCTKSRTIRAWCPT